MSESESQGDSLPALTGSQELVWMSQQLAPESTLFNMAHRFDIPLALDPARFRRALQAVVDASDALRTVFVQTSTGVQQQVRDSLPVELPVHDLSAAADPDAAAAQWVRERARRVLDLSDCCHESALLKLGEEHWAWFLNTHHLVADAWAVSLICRHVGRCYGLAEAGAVPAIDPLPSYLDYRRFEAEWRQGKAFRSAERYWSERVGAPSGLVALYGCKGVRGQTRSTRLTEGFGAERSGRLNELAQQPGYRSLSPHLSRFNLLATAVLAYLYRVGQNQHLTIGTPAHNRPTAAARDTIGLFIETLPFSVEVEEGDSFKALFDKVARESQYFLRNAQPGCSSPDTARLFNVVFNYINTSFGDFDGTPMQSELVHSDFVDSGHDLRIQIHDVGESGQYVVHFDCNRATYDESLREYMGGHFLRVLDAFLDDPQAVIDGVALVSPEEHRQLLREFNPEPPPAAAHAVLERIAAAARDCPAQVAVRSPEDSLSYAELDRRAQRLAVALRGRGVDAGTAVGICMRRSIDFVVAVLGTLRAGGLFVPLEARLPSERLAFIAADAGMALVLTEQLLRQREKETAVPWCTLDEMEATAGTAAGESSLLQVSPEQGAYIIYTSGSTGYPKGVEVPHRSLAAYIDWAHRRFAGGGRCDFPLYSSIGFDLTITSIFVPLCSGGTVRVYPEAEVGPDLSVLQVFAEDAVDVVKLTPAHLALVLEQPRRVSRIRSLILGGENLTTELAARALDSLGDLALFNEYGPTEAVVGCMRHRFDPATDTGPSVPIGVPADHHRIYLLDRGGNPVPRGVTGEIHIAGPYLASGYRNREDETAARFFPDPFRAGETMYRTGDLARFGAGGLLEYLGRADEQLKIGGVRIEPAEVIRAVRSFPGVEDCVVDVMETAPRTLGEEARYCTRCGISSEYPGISFDADGVCQLCSDFETYRDRAGIYFDDMDRLRELLAEARQRRRGQYDCIMLLSGGKDSTYALYRTAEQGPSILALTLDNGFISEDAKGNIRKVVESLGIDHRFIGTPAMNEIFRDSLERHSNVCQGCFKTIYTLAMRIALDEGIPYIVTGLSRGQFFETRLTPELFRDDDVDLITVERTVLEMRRAYHGVDDAVSRCLDVSMFEGEEVFDKVGFIDFYRYCDVSLAEVYRYLGERAPWVRPRDTGRSTNCLINEAGIYVHKRKEGFHNYALPYSWDVRMGHKTRDAALDELNDDIDVDNVHRMLDEIGYHEDAFQQGVAGKRLVAYYTGDGQIDETALRAHLASRLPAAMVPSFFVAMEAFPLTGNGKLDRRALPVPQIGRPKVDTVYQAPRDPLEQDLARIWREVLEVQRVGVEDNYYALGGDSISAIQIASRAQQEGLDLRAVDIFEHQTVESLAAHLAQRPGGGREAQSGEEGAPERFSMAALDKSKLGKVADMLSRKAR